MRFLQCFQMPTKVPHIERHAFKNVEWEAAAKQGCRSLLISSKRLLHVLGPCISEAERTSSGSDKEIPLHIADKHLESSFQAHKKRHCGRRTTLNWTSHAHIELYEFVFVGDLMVGRSLFPPWRWPIMTSQSRKSGWTSMTRDNYTTETKPAAMIRDLIIRCLNIWLHVLRSATSWNGEYWLWRHE